MQIGDRFVEIAGKDARGMTTEQVSALLKGTPNTNVTIKVEKLLTGQVEEVKLRRERIAISGVGYAGFVADSIGYIQHRDFTEGCYEDMRAALEGLQKQGLKALVLDYRNNGGGILQEAVKIVSMFVPKGTEVVTTKGRTEHTVYRTQTRPRRADAADRGAREATGRLRPPRSSPARCRIWTVRCSSASAPSARDWCRRRARWATTAS